MTGLIIFALLVAAVVVACLEVNSRMRRWEAAERARAADLFVPPPARQRGFVKSYDSATGGLIEPTAGGDMVVLAVASVERAGLAKVLAGQHVEYALVTKEGKTFAADLTFPPAPNKDCGCSK
jgi:cold shock CspA family protein